MAVKFGNNAATLLAANASSSATVLTVSDGSVFPTLSGADYTYVTLEDVNSNREIVKLTAISGNELTVVRAQDGSSARAFSTSDKCELRITAALLNAVSTETVNGTSARFKFTATANQTTFSGSDDNSVTLAYNVGYIDLYLSGIRLIAGSDYTASNGTSIVLAAGASVNDIIEIVSYGTFVLADIAINDMTDVNTTGVADGSILAYDNTDSRFEKSTILSQSSSGIAVVGNITATGTVDGRDVATDGTKLDGVEASADVTDATNVTAAGALMDSELTSIASVKALNQGVATGDSPTFATLTSTGEITANGGIALGDNDKATFGASDDLQIYHDGNHSYIEDAGTGSIKIKVGDFRVENASGNNLIKGVGDVATLHHAGSEKLATTSTGIDVTGSVTADSLTVDTSAGQLDVEALGGSSVKVKSSGSLKLQGTGGSVDLINGSTEVLSTTSSGISVNGTATMDGLTVDTAAPFMSFRESGATKLFIGESSAVGGGAGYYDFYAVTGLGQRFFTNSVERMRIDSSGNVGIACSPATGVRTKIKGLAEATNLATSATSAALFIEPYSGSSWGLGIGSVTGQKQYIQAVSAAGDGTKELLLQPFGGNVLVGLSSTSGIATGSTADNGVYVDGTEGAVVAQSSANKNLYLSKASGYSDPDFISFQVNGSSVGSIGTQGGDLNIGTGACGISFVDGVPALYPWTTTGNATRDAAIDLGDSGARFKDLYITGLNVTYSTYNKISSYFSGSYTSGFKFSDMNGGIWYDAGTDDLTVSAGHANSQLILVSGGSESMRIDSSGRLLVGQTGNYPATGGGTTKGVFAASADSRTDLIVSNQTNGSNAGAALVLGAYGHDHIIESQSLAQGGGLTFTRSAVENMRIDSSGNLLVGKTATTLSVAGTYISPTGSVGVTRASDDCLTLNRTGNDGAIASFYKDGTTVGSIGSEGGDSVYIQGGTTSGSGLHFHATTSDITPLRNGARIDNVIDLGNSSNRFKDLYLSGKIAKGTGGELDLRSDGGGFKYKQNLDVATAGCTFTGQSNRGDVAQIRLYQTAAGADGGYIRFDTSNSGSTTPTEKVRIDSAGNLMVGKTSVSDSVAGGKIASDGRMIQGLDGTGAADFHDFYRGTAGSLARVGNIRSSGTSVAYNTSSDQRLKENIADADDAGSKIDAIQVRKFDWKADGSHQDYGMIAQELEAVAPEAVSGDADSEEMMGVDYSKLVPMLIKEIQSLRNRVAQLEE